MFGDTVLTVAPVVSSPVQNLWYMSPLVPTLLAMYMLRMPGVYTNYGICGDREPIGRVVDVMTVDDQPVQIRRAVDAVWMSAEKGETLCEGDQMRTRFRSRARIRVAAPSGRPIDIVLGVNARVRTIGNWGGGQQKSAEPAVLDVVHGVVRLRGETGNADPSGIQYVRTGPTVCAFHGGEALANWDPFKREANFVVQSGRVECSFPDSTYTIHPGSRLEIVRGEPVPVEPVSSLILRTFEGATEMD